MKLFLIFVCYLLNVLVEGTLWAAAVQPFILTFGAILGAVDLELLDVEPIHWRNIIHFKKPHPETEIKVEYEHPTYEEPPKNRPIPKSNTEEAMEAIKGIEPYPYEVAKEHEKRFWASKKKYMEENKEKIEKEKEEINEKMRLKEEKLVKELLEKRRREKKEREARGESPKSQMELSDRYYDYDGS